MVSLPSGAGPEQLVLQQRGGQKMRSPFVLGKVDILAPARLAAVFERCQDGDITVADGDVVDVGAVNKHRRPAGLSGQVRESAERGKLRAKAGMLRAGAGLPQVACAQHDEPRIDGFQHIVAQPQLAHCSGRKVFHDDIGFGDQLFSRLHPGRHLQVQPDAVDTVVVHGKNTGPVQTLDVVLKGRIVGSEAFRTAGGFHLDDKCAVVGHVFPNTRSRRKCGEFDYCNAF